MASGMFWAAWLAVGATIRLRRAIKTNQALVPLTLYKANLAAFIMPLYQNEFPALSYRQSLQSSQLILWVLYQASSLKGELCIKPVGVMNMKLPPEVLQMACSLLDKKTLKNVRLVCKALEQAAVPFLFDQVSLSSSHREIGYANRITSHFAPHIKTITLFFRRFPEITETTSECRDRVAIDHTKQAIQIWYKARAEHIEIMKSGEFLVQLCQILSKLPYARKLALECKGYGDQKPYRPPYTYQLPWETRDFYPYDRCDLSDDDHLRYQRLPCLGYRDQDPNPWHLIMLALFVTNSSITEIVSFVPRGPRESRGGLIPMYNFATTPRLGFFTTKRSSLLTKLRLTLTINHRPVEKGTEFYFADRSVARTLSAAVNLQMLGIECDNFMPQDSNGSSLGTYFSAILAGCRFPKLGTLVLSNMKGTDRELLDLLEDCPGVEHLVMEEFLLEAGTWAAVAARIRGILQLKSVSMKHLHGEDGTLDDRVYEDEPKSRIRLKYNHEVIEDFFLRDGENPFTQESMDRFHNNNKRDQASKEDRAELNRQRRLALYN